MEEILRQYGQTAVLYTADGNRDILAFLQPVTEKTEAEPFCMTALGSVDDRLWLYLGREALNPGDIVERNESRFQVRSSRAYYVGETLSHWWAVLCPEWEAME